MTQITTHTVTQPGDIVVVIPGWLIRLVGFLGLFGGFTLGIMAMLAGYPIEGFLLVLFTVVWTPIWMLLHYIVWRFYWYLLAASLGLQAPLWVGVFLYITAGRVALPSQFQGLNFSANPINGILALILAAIVTGALYRLYMLSRGSRPATHDNPAAPAAAPAAPNMPDAHDFNFSSAAPSGTGGTLMDKVVRKLEKTGARGEVKSNDTIYVYKGVQMVGIVRVMDRPALISPVLVKDVVSQRDRLGVQLAYLATNGNFTDETRVLATQWGIKLMTV